MDLIFGYSFPPPLPQSLAFGNKEHTRRIFLFRNNKELGNSICLSSTYNLRHSKYIFFIVNIVSVNKFTTLVCCGHIQRYV